MIKGGDIQKQDIKKDLTCKCWQQLKSKIIQKKRIYNIEENGGRPQKYIYVLIITYGAKKKI